MKHLETEFKWDANTPRAFVRMQRVLERTEGVKHLSPLRQLTICDVYLDNPAGDFSRGKIAFRVRCTDGVWEATFKTRTAVCNGKAVRREETLPLVGVTNLAGALRVLDGRKVWQGLDVQGLKPMFEIHNQRKTLDISYAGARAEMAFDSFEIRVLGRRVKMKEIELEHKHGRLKSTERLVQELTQKSGLAYAKISKVKTATALLALWGKV